MSESCDVCVKVTDAISAFLSVKGLQADAEELSELVCKLLPGKECGQCRDICGGPGGRAKRRYQCDDVYATVDDVYATVDDDNETVDDVYATVDDVYATVDYVYMYVC